MSEIQWAVDIFEKYGIKTTLDSNNMIIISHYNQPNGTTFEQMGINEDELIKNVIACLGRFETRNSKLTTFPLVVSREIRLDSEIEISEMPNLKAVGILLGNKKLKKLPKTAGSISLEDSPVKSIPKLREAGVLIAQNSELRELPSLETVSKLCVIDCPLEDLGDLETGEDIFLCSTDINKKMDIKTLSDLEEVKKLFVANANLKSLPKLKRAEKIALYNCDIRNVKSSLKAEVEIGNEISDKELSEKFDSFTDWYNSDVLQKSMDLLGDIVNRIQS